MSGTWTSPRTLLGFSNLFAGLSIAWKMNFKILSTNSHNLELWKDPCIMDVPIMSEPTFLNMSLVFENLDFFNILTQNRFNVEYLNIILGWIWIGIGLLISRLTMIPIPFGFGAHTLKPSIAPTVYDYPSFRDSNPWPSWQHIWKLCVLPRIKTFIWKLAHGNLPISAYLYDLNIGPYTLCNFCGSKLKQPII